MITACRRDLILIEAVSIMLTIIVVAVDIAVLTANSSTLPQANYLSPAISAFGSVGSLTTDSLRGVMYVENKDSNSISVVDLATNTIVRNIAVDEKLYNIKLSEDQLKLYIITADSDSGTILTLNTTDNEIMNEIATGVSIQNIAIFNGTLYVGDVLGGRVLVMNTNGTLIGEIDIGSRPQYMEVRPDGEVLYVTRLGGGPISVVDLEQNVVIKEIDSGSMPRGLSFTNDGARLFVVNEESDTLSVIDTHKQEVIKTISVGDNPQYVVLNPDETLAYVTNMNSNTISIVDAQVVEVVNEIPVGNGPYGIAFSADGGDLSYVSNRRGNDVSIINTRSSNISASLSSGGAGPNELVVRKPDIEIIRTEDNNNSSVIARVFVEVSDDQEELMRGLMFRQHLPWNAGMLFAFNDEDPRTFWMKNTLIPLDMIFVDSDSKIVDIIENVPPCKQDECPTYPSKEPAQHVLEVNAGYVQDTGVKIGDHLATFNGFKANGTDSKYSEIVPINFS
jgi:YVTN family beta-propeller protein